MKSKLLITFPIIFLLFSGFTQKNENWINNFRAATERLIKAKNDLYAVRSEGVSYGFPDTLGDDDFRGNNLDINKTDIGNSMTTLNALNNELEANDQLLLKNILKMKRG